MIKLGLANIVTAFSGQTIGTKVTNHTAFLDLLEEEIRYHDVSNDRAPGQHFIQLPVSATNMVSCGVGKRTQNPEDYVIRTHRGNVSLYLKRERAASADSVACVVYTREAYLADPDMTPEEAGRVAAAEADTTHFIVAVLASSEGSDPVVSPYRFVHNLAGGNHEYDLSARVDESIDHQYLKTDLEAYFEAQVNAWEDQFEWLQEKALQSKIYSETWKTVAD